MTDKLDVLLKQVHAELQKIDKVDADKPQAFARIWSRMCSPC